MDKGTEFLDAGFDKLSGSFWQKFLESFAEGSKNNRAKFLSIFFLLLIVTYAGVELVKILFRKRFGKKGLRSAKLVFVGLALLGVSIGAFTQYFTSDEVDPLWIGSKETALLTGILYVILFFYVAIKGFREKGKAHLYSTPEYYRGTSTIFSFLIKSGWKPSSVQNLAEPLFLLAIGIFLLPNSFLLGLPLIASSISYWIHLAAERLMNFHDLRDQMADRGHKIDEESAFVEVIN